MTIEVRLEGFTLAVEDVNRSVEFYGEKLGLVVEANRAPTFALIRVGGPLGGTIGLLSTRLPEAAAARRRTALVAFSTVFQPRAEPCSAQ